MSYSIYTTRGFVLGSAPRGEANKTFFLYTSDFGLVRAGAQGVRLLKSKLRYNLDDFSCGYFSLVRGKELWRLTGSERDVIVASPEARRAVARVLHLVFRLVHGEEKNPLLFSALDSMISYAVRVPEEARDLSAFESLSLLRVLHSLGYIGAIDGVLPGSFSGEITDAALSSVSSRKGEVLAHINKAIRESQL